MLVLLYRRHVVWTGPVVNEKSVPWHPWEKIQLKSDRIYLTFYLLDIHSTLQLMVFWFADNVKIVRDKFTQSFLFWVGHRNFVCYTPAQRSRRGVYWIHLVRPSVRPSVCRRHGFRSISQVCFGISISNFICMLMVVISRSLLIFNDITFKMAAWWPNWIFWFPDSNFSLALNINSKLKWHNTYVYV